MYDSMFQSNMDANVSEALLAHLDTLSIPTLKRITPKLREGASNLTEFFNKEMGDSGKTFVDGGCILHPDIAWTYLVNCLILLAAAIFTKATMDVTGVTVLGVKLDNLKSKHPKYKLVAPL